MRLPPERVGVVPLLPLFSKNKNACPFLWGLGRAFATKAGAIFNSFIRSKLSVPAEMSARPCANQGPRFLRSHSFAWRKKQLSIKKQKTPKILLLKLQELHRSIVFAASYH